ncbi:sensor histidine kinase, partial [Lacticaseibacillus paracasei]
QLLNSDDSQKHIDAKHALKVIERNARAQSEMISEILFVSRIITGKLKLITQPLDIVPVARTAIDTVRPSLDAKHIKLNAFFDENAPPVSG